MIDFKRSSQRAPSGERPELNGRAPASHVEFDYESKLWGGHPVRVSPTFLGALRLEYCLQDLVGLQGNVLEVGCGAGGMAKAIKAYRPDLQIFGCDISREAIGAAQQDPQEVVFGLANADGLPYPAESFAAVVMFDVLEHLESPDTAVQAIWRVLRPDGLLHLFVPIEGALHTLHGLLALAGWRAKEHYGGHIQRFALREVRKVLIGAGLRIERQRWSCHLVNQTVDVAYFSLLSLRGRNTTLSVEGYLEAATPGVLRSTVLAAKSAIAAVSYFESKAFARVGGAGIHLAARKNGNEGIATLP